VAPHRCGRRWRPERTVRQTFPFGPAPAPPGGPLAFTHCSFDPRRSVPSPQWVLTSPVTDELLRALTDPTRARIVELLAGEQLCVCHLAAETGATSSNLSNHLRLLKDLGAVEAEPAGRYTYYRLRPEVLEAVSAHYAALASRARLAVAVKRPCD